MQNYKLFEKLITEKFYICQYYNKSKANVITVSKINFSC